MNVSKENHYQGYALAVQVLILGQDVKEYLRTISDISHQTDYPSLTEYRVSDCTLELIDPSGFFSPENSSNFFTANGGVQTGFQASVQVEAGFIIPGQTLPQLQTMFKGTILSVSTEAKTAVVKIVCGDVSRKLRNDKIIDLGLRKKFSLTQTRPQTSSNGTYKILKAVFPISNESENLFKEGFGEPITPVEELSTEGVLNPNHYIIDSEGVVSEGGFIEIDAANVHYPQLEIKAPFRNRDINQIIHSILDQRTEITTNSIEIPDITSEDHFSTNGRVGYEIIGTSSSDLPLTWKGYVTDVIYDDPKFYFLYNPDVNDVRRPAIIEYDTITKRYTVIHYGLAPRAKVEATPTTPKIPARGVTQYWKFAKHSTSFYILCTDNTIYDSVESGCGTHIKIFTPPNTINNFVPNNVTLRPQLAHFYGMGTQLYGAAGYYQKTKTFLPDTRRNMVYVGPPASSSIQGLYYTYVDRTAQIFGIAKANPSAQTPIIQIDMDGHENHAGLSFTINNNKIYGAVTFKTASNSTITTFTKQLG